jgi:hypothetical protein
LSYASSSTAAVIRPAGLDKSKGVITVEFIIDVNDPRSKDDPGVKAWKEFTSKYLSETEFADGNAAYGFGAAATMVQALTQCGDDLSRDNIMRQATNIKKFHAPMLMPGVTIDTAPDNFTPIRRLQLARFNGENWEPFGEVMQG